MSRNISFTKRNEIAKENRQTLLAWNNLFWLGMMLLVGVKLRQVGLWEGGWAFIMTFIEIVTMLLITTEEKIKLDYYKSSFIDPFKIGLTLFIIGKIIDWVF